MKKNRILRIYQDMLTVSPSESPKAMGGGKRGKVKVFSVESRLRLFRLLHRLEFRRVLFVTLTYPDAFPTQKEVYKGHLKNFRYEFEKRWGAIPTVWRLEFQERGAPHYHLMMLDAEFIPIKELSALWHGVIGSDDPNHLKNGVDLKLSAGGKDKALIAYYLGKYVAKVDTSGVGEGDYNPGRWWGKWNIVEQEPVEIEVYDWEAEKILGQLIDERKREAYEPADLTIGTLFGEYMGGREFQKRAIEITSAVTKKTRVKKPQKKVQNA